MILKGAKVAADNVLFEVNETVSIAENGSVEVGATCTVSGSAGNVKKGDINRFPITLPGITAVQNITDFTGGYDAESDADLLNDTLKKCHVRMSAEINIIILNGQKEVSGVGDVKSNTALERSGDSKSSNCRC